MNNYLRLRVHRMARITKTVITERHLQILEYVYAYYEKNKVGPLYYTLKKQLGVTRQEIETLFPRGLNSIYSWVGIHIHTTRDICKPVPAIPVADHRQVYLDHNATTYPRAAVVRMLDQYHADAAGFGNPSSSTLPGKNAHDMVQKARLQLAECLGVTPKEIIFVGGGSEANNTAIKGVAFQHLKEKGHLITTKIEHPSVLHPMQYLEELGFEVTYLDVDGKGRVRPEAVKAHLRKETLLVAVMSANNEIGTINPIEKIGRICRQKAVPFMVDAVQSFGRCRLNPKQMGISLLSVSSHKVYGPKGAGALYVDESLPLTPLIHGGAQEFGRRAGTENVGSIAAFGEAARLIHAEMVQENQRLLKLRSYFLNRLQAAVPDAVVNGCLKNRLPHNLSIGFPRIDSGALLLALNQIGIYVSAGSACSAGSTEDSHVLRAIGLDTQRYGTIRFSFGLRTTKADLDYLFKYLPVILKKI